MENERVSKAESIFLLSLGAVTLIMVVFASWLWWDNYGTRTYEVPPVLEEVLDMYLQGEELPSIETEDGVKWFEDHFEDTGDDSLQDTAFYLEEALCSFTPAVREYEVSPVSDSFCIIRLYGEDGKLMPPPIGFWCEVSEDGKKLTSWYVGRLLPFSRYDKEYSEVWDNVY